VNRTEKEDLVAEMRSVFEGTNLVVVTHYSGMTVAQMSNLRGCVREVGASFKVTKNRLARLALEGTKFQPLANMFTGPTAIAYSTDPVAAAKAPATRIAGVLQAPASQLARVFGAYANKDEAA
jgi:large subunit ribosomal protein L10